MGCGLIPQAEEKGELGPPLADPPRLEIPEASEERKFIFKFLDSSIAALLR